MTGSLLRALVMRNHWLLARPAARATGLAPPAGFRWFRAGCSWPFVERAFHAGQLVLGSSNSSRHWSRSALVSAGSALVALGPFLSALGARNRLVLGSPGTSRHCSRSALVFAVCACCTTQSPGCSSVGLAPRWSLPVTSSVAAQSPARANSTGIRSLSSVPHLWSSSFDCPASSGKEKTKCV